jgi:hypothetical protein
MNRINIPNDFKHYSVSKLKTLSLCGEYYKKKYVEKVVVEESISYGALVGTLVHNCLELAYSEYSKRFKPLDYYHQTGKEVLDSYKLKNYNYELLNSYLEEVEQLYIKASIEYNEEDSIRKQNGDITRHPELTSKWKKLYKDLGLETYKYTLDQCFPPTSKKDKTIVDAYIEGYQIVKRYKHPSIIKTIEAIEYPISSRDGNEIVNPLLLPNSYRKKGDIYFMGYIDLIGRDKDNKVVIIDHKTSSKDFTQQDVYHNVQLCAYAWAYKKLNKEDVGYIGINNLSSGNLVVIKTPSDNHIKQIVKCLFDNHKIIEQELFYKHTPEPYSPCLSMYGAPCPYLKLCWGDISSSFTFSS